MDKSTNIQISNSNGVNERVLTDSIDTFSTTKTAIASIIPPVNATLNTMLRIRVISEYKDAPAVCGTGFVKRADDYGVIVTNPLSTTNLLNSEVVLYPNPVKDKLTVSLKNRQGSILVPNNFTVHLLH